MNQFSLQATMFNKIIINVVCFKCCRVANVVIKYTAAVRLSEAYSHHHHHHQIA